MSVSILTIVRGRHAHLANVMRGLARQTVRPRELVIAVMEDARIADLPELPFEVRQILVPGDPLPLATARNAAARAATGEALLFLDVDCIPAPTFVEDYLTALHHQPGLLMGEVLYLPAGATERGLDFDRFARIAERHSDRRGPPPEGCVPCEDYRCFWSLNFALTAATFARTGGFCEGYRGYGGEDTDFGRILDMLDVPLSWMRGGRVYHQHHAHHMPPVHHIDSILRNTALFRDRWGHHTMDHWLRAFRMMGLAASTERGWIKLREPDAADLALTRQPEDAPYVNTARVIRELEARIAAA